MTSKNAQKEKDFRGTHRDIFWGGFITLGWNGGNALLSVTPHLFICTSKWTRSEAINDGFGDIGMSLEITINKKQTGYGEVTIFSLVNLLTFYSIMDVVQGIMKCSVIDGASCSFRGLQDPLSGGWRAAHSAKRHPLCLQPQQLPQGLDCGLLSTVRPICYAGPTETQEGKGAPRGFSGHCPTSPLFLWRHPAMWYHSLSQNANSSWNLGGPIEGTDHSELLPFNTGTGSWYSHCTRYLLGHREVWGITGEDSQNVEGTPRVTIPIF